MKPIIAVNAGNEPSEYQAFNAFVNGQLGGGSVFFDQRSEAQFRGAAVSYQAPQGGLVQRAVPGSFIKYSLSFPGAAIDVCQAVAEGKFDDLYRDILQAIARANAGNVQIIIRLPWEFNLKREYQNQSVEGVQSWFKSAQNRIALIIRRILSRALIEWCPNVGMQQFDPAPYTPWTELYDIVAQDLYIPDQSWVWPGLASWLINDGGGRGCAWAIDLALRKGKKFALAEWAVESERHAAEMQVICDFLKSLDSSTLHHHAYWSRGDGPITGKLHDGSRPTLAAIYKGAFVQ